MLHDDPIKAFVAAIDARDRDAFAAYLDPSVEWVTRGLPTLAGRDAVLRYCDRFLLRYPATRVSLIRLMADGETRVAEQAHFVDRRESPPFLIANIVVYRLNERRIVHFAHHFDLSGVPADEVSAWRRLRGLA